MPPTHTESGTGTHCVVHSRTRARVVGAMGASPRPPYSSHIPLIVSTVQSTSFLPPSGPMGVLAATAP